MKFTLTRYMQNRTFVHGRMTIEGTNYVFETMERAIPQDRKSYVKHCLPPGIYPLDVHAVMLSIGGCNVRRPYIALAKIKWFPKAAILTSFTDNSLMAGRILVGSKSKDEWSVEQDDLVTAKIVTAIQPIYEEAIDAATEPVTLEIIELPDMEIHDIDIHQHNREELIAKEEQARKLAELRIAELMEQARAPQPPKGESFDYSC